MNKRLKKNHYRTRLDSKKRFQTADSKTDTAFKRTRILMAILLTAGLSLGAILIYDLLTQSPLFMIQQIIVSGENRVPRSKILELTALTRPENIFKVNVHTMEKQLTAHPWIARASVKRRYCSTLEISITEEVPLAIVNIESMARLLINTQGNPFKEYEPQKDKVGNLPVISGVDLTLSDNEYRFQGPLFNSIMDFFNTDPIVGKQVTNLDGDNRTGLLVQAKDIYNSGPTSLDHLIPIKLGFDRFEEKLFKAKQISAYMDKHFPDKTICAMDLFDIEKAFIKIKDNDALHSDMKKGV